MIPKTIIQTSDKPLEEHVAELIKQACPDFTYLYYSDDDARNFIIQNTTLEFPNLVNKFDELEGCFRADLFRTYYTYLYGGFYLDADAMFYKDLTPIAEKYDMMVVGSWDWKEKIFIGGTGCRAGHPVYKDMLHFICNTSQKQLDDNYFLFCMQMGKILKEHIDNGCEKVLYLHEYLVEEGANVDYPEEFSNSGVLLTHYWITKKVPKNVEDLKKEIAEAVADYELYCKKNNIVVRTAKDSVVEITDQMNLKSLKI